MYKLCIIVADIVPQYMMVQNIHTDTAYTELHPSHVAYTTQDCYYTKMYGEHKTFVSQLYRIDWGMITNLLPDTNILNPHLKRMKHGKRHGVEMCCKHCHFYTAMLYVRTSLEVHIDGWEAGLAMFIFAGVRYNLSI